MFRTDFSEALGSVLQRFLRVLTLGRLHLHQYRGKYNFSTRAPALEIPASARRESPTLLDLQQSPQSGLQTIHPQAGLLEMLFHTSQSQERSFQFQIQNASDHHKVLGFYKISKAPNFHNFHKLQLHNNFPLPRYLGSQIFLLQEIVRDLNTAKPFPFLAQKKAAKLQHHSCF